jgi:predicted ATPase
MDAGVCCLAYNARALWFLGYPDQALKRGYEALARAQAPSVTLSLAQAMAVLANVHHVRGELQLTGDWAEKTVKYSTEQRIPFWAAFSRIVQGWLLAERGEAEVGVAQILKSVAAYEGTGARLGRSWFLVLLAEAYQHNGQTAEGLNMLDQAIGFIEETEEAYYAPEVHRVRGELLLVQGGRRTADEAEACFQTSLAIARSQQARSWELRAAVSMARLLLDQGRRNEAHELLAPIYGWFIEGLGTADLEEARRLLEDA